MSCDFDWICCLISSKIALLFAFVVTNLKWFVFDFPLLASVWEFYLVQRTSIWCCVHEIGFIRGFWVGVWLAESFSMEQVSSANHSWTALILAAVMQESPSIHLAAWSAFFSCSEPAFHIYCWFYSFQYLHRVYQFFDSASVPAK